MTIVVSPEAEKDLREAYEYILQDNPIAAGRVLAHIVEVIGMLASEAVKDERCCFGMADGSRRGRFHRIEFTIESGAKSYK